MHGKVCPPLSPKGSNRSSISCRNGPTGNTVKFSLSWLAAIFEIRSTVLNISLTPSSSLAASSSCSSLVSSSAGFCNCRKNCRKALFNSIRTGSWQWVLQDHTWLWMIKPKMYLRRRTDKNSYSRFLPSYATDPPPSPGGLYVMTGGCRSSSTNRVASPPSFRIMSFIRVNVISTVPNLL